MRKTHRNLETLKQWLFSVSLSWCKRQAVASHIYNLHYTFNIPKKSSGNRSCKQQSHFQTKPLYKNRGNFLNFQWSRDFGVGKPNVFQAPLAETSYGPPPQARLSGGASIRSNQQLGFCHDFHTQHPGYEIFRELIGTSFTFGSTSIWHWQIKWLNTISTWV